MLLKIENLSIEFETLRGKVRPVDGLTIHVREGEALGIVGESGCGKSLTSLAIMGLLPPNAKVTASQMSFNGQDLLKMPEAARRKLRGGQMSMIFQDPMTSLNPSFTVGFQLSEMLMEHEGMSSKKSWERSRELLGQVGIPDPESRLSSYSYQLSGGMSQRVMIAMAMACRPKLLIADEPTTALDVTIQAQILELIKKLQREHKMALILITHDIGVVAQMADRIAVMYAGQAVEEGLIRDVIDRARHPYTKGLLDCLPGMHDESEHRTKLPSIPGLVPDLVNRPVGCQFHPRCQRAQDKCKTQMPEIVQEPGRLVRCFYPVEASV